MLVRWLPFAALAFAHLAAQLAGAETVAKVTQWLVMPALAAAVWSAIPRDRLVRLVLLALGFSWLGKVALRLVGTAPPGSASAISREAGPCPPVTHWGAPAIPERNPPQGHTDKPHGQQQGSVKVGWVALW